VGVHEGAKTRGAVTRRVHRHGLPGSAQREWGGVGTSTQGRKGARAQGAHGGASAAYTVANGRGRGRQRNSEPRMNANGRESERRESRVEGGSTRLPVWPGRQRPNAEGGGHRDRRRGRWPVGMESALKAGLAQRRQGAKGGPATPAAPMVSPARSLPRQGCLSTKRHEGRCAPTRRGAPPAPSAAPSARWSGGRPGGGESRSSCAFVCLRGQPRLQGPGRGSAHHRRERAPRDPSPFMPFMVFMVNKGPGSATAPPRDSRRRGRGRPPPLRLCASARGERFAPSRR